MKIAVDISQIVYQGTGVARYTRSVVESILKFDTKNNYVFFFSSLRRKIPADLRSQILKKHTLREFRIPPTILEFLWNKLHILPMESFVGDVDIVFTSDWAEPPVKRAKKVTTLHDLVVYRYPETSHDATEINLKGMTIRSNIVSIQKRRLNRVKQETDIFICDSQSTADDASIYLNIPQDKLRIIYPAVEINTTPSSSRSAQERPFILTVGTIQPRKNLKRLIAAFGKAGLPEVDLVIVGTAGWGENISHEDVKNVKFLGYVADNELMKLYKEALFFIYPSLYEGFGYPVVEAMASASPVATSNTSSLREIAEGYGVLFDPNSEEDITSALVRLYKDEKLRDSLKTKSLMRARDFTMEKFAAQLIKVFDDLYANRS